jgi:TP901 family phage tail tape measure protein
MFPRERGIALATRNISTKLAIDGESQYREALKSINAEMRQMQANMKLTESAFAGNSNSMEALRAKGAALAEAHRVQAEKVRALQDALQNAKNAEESYVNNGKRLEAQIAANRAKMEELKNSAGNTAAEEAKLAAETEKLEKELETNNRYLDAAKSGVTNWQLSLTRAQTDLNKLDNEINQNNEAMRNAGQNAEQFGNKMNGAADKVGAAGDRLGEATSSISELDGLLASAGIVAMLDKIADAFEACVDAASGFEYAMSAVEAISGGSAEEIDLLNDKAKEIGANTMYTAQQAADALGYMALAGWDAQEMLGGVDGVISLAAASGENLSAVSDIVTDSLTAFGLSAKDTGRFVDVLAAAASNSNTTVTMLGEAFKYAAPVAGALGYSIEDVAVAMGLMANNGIKGSMAGTALRTTFSSLADSVKIAGKSFGEVEISGANADGTMKTFSETINELRGYFNQMSEAEQVANAQAIAGKRAYAGLLAILNSTEDDYNSLTAAIQNSTGAAEQMAKIRMDNYTGQVTLLKSAFDGVKIAVGSQLTPALSTLVQTITPMLSKFSEFVDTHERFVPAVTAVVGALATLVTTIGAFAVGIKAASIAAAAFNLVLDTNPIFLAISAIAALTVGIATFFGTVDDGVPSVEEMTEAMDASVEKFNAAQEAYGKTAEDVEATALVGEKLCDRLDELGAKASLTADEQAEYNGILAQLKELFPDLNIAIDENTGHIQGGTEAIRAQIEEWKNLAIQEAMYTMYKEEVAAYTQMLVEHEKQVQELASAKAEGKALEDQYNEALREQKQLMDELDAAEHDHSGSQEEHESRVDALREKLAAQSSTVNDLKDKLEANQHMQENLNEAISEGSGAIDEYKEKFETAQEAIDAVYEKLTSGVDDAADAGSEAGLQFVAGVADGASDTGSASEAGAAVGDALADGAKGALDEHSPSKVGIDIGKNFDEGVAQGARANISLITTALTAGFNQIKSQTKTAGEECSKGFKNGFEKITSQTQSTLSSLRSTIRSGTSGMYSEMYSVGSNVVAGMISGMNSRSSSLYATIRQIVTHSIAVAQAAAAVQSPSKKTEWIYANVIEGGIVGIEKNADRLHRAMQKATDMSLDVSVDTRKLEGLEVEFDGAMQSGLDRDAQVLSLDTEPLAERFDRMENTFGRVIDAIRQWKVVLDTGETVGALADPLDEELGYRAKIEQGRSFA